MKKVLIGCGIAAVLLIGFVVLVFYLAFRPKFKDVSNVAPFVEISGKTITTKKETLILKHPSVPTDENYIFYLEDGNSFGMNSDLPTIAAFPIGTEITIDKVELHTGRVSGTTSAYVFGKVYSEEKQQEYAFQYSWGDYRSLLEDKPYWIFEQAFWQDEALEGKYFIDVP